MSGEAVAKVVGEWRKPAHEDFAPRNVWSLFNDFTGSAQRDCPDGRCRAAMTFTACLTPIVNSRCSRRRPQQRALPQENTLWLTEYPAEIGIGGKLPRSLLEVFPISDLRLDWDATPFDASSEDGNFECRDENDLLHFADAR